MILDGLQVIAGILFTLFIPGFLLDMVLFRRKALIERIAYAIFFSIIIDLVILFIWGGSRFQMDLSGGVTRFSMWASLIGASLVWAGFILHQLLKAKKSLRSYFVPEFIDARLKQITLLQIALLLLLIIFFYKKASGSWPFWLFWPIILANAGLAAYSALEMKSVYRILPLLVLQAAVTSVFVFGIIEPYQMNTDSYFEAQYASTIITEQYWNPELGNGIAANYYGYNPLVHAVIAMLSITTGLSSFAVTKYIVLYVIRLGICLVAFLLISELAGRRMASIATLIFIASHGYVLVFVSRRYIAAMFILYLFYFMVKYSQSGKSHNLVFAIICSFLVLLGDHANSYLLLLILIGGLSFSWLIERVFPDRFPKPERRIFDWRLIAAYIIMMVLWISLVAQVFIAQDFFYVTDVSSFMMSQSTESSKKTIDLALESITKFTKGIYLKVSKKIHELIDEPQPALPPSTVAEYQERLAVLSASQDPKDMELAKQIRAKLGQENLLTETRGSGLKLTYTYELFIIIASQAMFLGFASLGLIRTFIFCWRKKETGLDISKSEFLFLAITAVSGFFILGLFINTDQIVFTYTYYWFFSFLSSILVSQAIINLKNTFFGRFTAVFIALFIFLMAGTLLLDYSSTLVNREPGKGVYVEHQYSLTQDVFEMLDWFSSSVDPHSVFVMDSNTWTIASSYYNYSKEYSWYNKRFYTDPSSTYKGIKGKYPDESIYFVVNNNFFTYPSITFGRKLPERYKSAYSSYGTNLVYSNGKYEVLKLA